MRKIVSLVVSSSLVFQLLPVVALAAFHEALKQKREEAKQGVQQKRDQFKQEVQQKRDALKKEFDEKKAILKAEIEKKREEFKKEAGTRKEALKKKLGEKRAERIEAFFNKMVEKFENAIERLKKLADRIAGRLDKAEANGKDVKALRDQLAKARDKISDAEKALADAKVKFTEAAKGADFKAAFQKVKELVSAVATKVKEAHRALVEVVNSIKGLGGGAKGEEPEGKKSERTVEITAGGFAPAELKIKAGTKVTFTNRDSAPHWPASGIHPTHEICPGFDALKGLATGESYSLTFTEAKTCPMHDHLNPTTITGSITVE